MISFMDYVVQSFGTATDWNPDNSYSSLTATSDALLSFSTPSTLALHVSKLSTANFATSYTLSTLGQIDGSISYLYTAIPLGHFPSASSSIPLKHLVRGYRDIRLPRLERDPEYDAIIERIGRKPTLLFATLALPPPSTLTALYARRINPETFLSISVHSKSVTKPNTNTGPPPAAVLAHIQRDAGYYSIEGLGSTDSALLGIRGLWNFGLSPPDTTRPHPISPPTTEALGDLTDLPLLERPDFHHSAIDSLTSHRSRLASKPSLLSAGAEFYYSPFSHVIGLSTGLRFTTLLPHITPTPVSPSSSKTLFRKPLSGTSAALSSSLLTPSNITHSSFPYTMTLTLTPLTGSISSSYSVRPTPNLALSSRCDFNFYSWESQYILGAEIWRPRRAKRFPAATEPSSSTTVELNSLRWTEAKLHDWFTPQEKSLKEARLDREEESVINVRIDDGWNFRALWTGRVKALLVSAGVSVSPVSTSFLGVGPDENGRTQKWTGSVGVSVAYSS